jgi:hypothetical protein
MLAGGNWAPADRRGGQLIRRIGPNRLAAGETEEGGGKEGVEVESGIHAKESGILTQARKADETRQVYRKTFKA